jgi:very-short-patch-repair endonuclease
LYTAFKIDIFVIELTLNQFFVVEYKHVDIVFERPKLHIEVDGIQHNQSTRQALSDLKRTFYSMQDGFLTIRIPNILVRNELTETVNYLVELILERYYKHM